MTSNVTPLIPRNHAPTALRNIADGMEDGDIPAVEVTVIVGSDVYHLGATSDDRAAESAVFNMTMGIHKLMHPVITEL